MTPDSPVAVIWFADGVEAKGQKPMSESIPVTMASDQTSIQITTSPSGATSGISFGDTTLAAISTDNPVRRTTYTEQTVNFTGSIISTSANDAAAGTGVRTVKITYYDSTGAGPFTENVTMNGVTGVNLVNANHCFIEKMEVLTVGAVGSAVGTIALHTGAGGAGTTVGSIAIGDNQTFWNHHYVATGKSCYVTAAFTGSSSNAVAQTAVFYLRKHAIGVANAPELQITDFMTVGGVQGSTPRNYGSPIQVAGPARLLMYVDTTVATSLVYRGAFDFYDQ